MHRKILCLLMLGIAGTVWADEFSEFRVPRNRVSTARVGLDFSLFRNQGSDEPEGSTSLLAEQNGRLTTTYLWRSESDAAVIEFITFGSFLESTRQVWSNGEDTERQSRIRTEGRNYELVARLDPSTEIEWYILGKYMGIRADAVLRIDYYQGGGTSMRSDRRSDYFDGIDRVYRDDGRWERWNQQYLAELSFGPVFGRIRNVTAIADALVMEQRLIEEGVLSGPLTAEARAELTNLLYKQPTYRYVHDRWQKYFWTEIESIIKDDPAYVQVLGVFAILRIQEQYFGTMLRKRGVMISPVYYYTHENEMQHSWESHTGTVIDTVVNQHREERYTSSNEHRDRGHIGVKAEYSIPIGLRWQCDTWASLIRYSSDFNSPSPNYLTYSTYFTLGSSAGWMIADRWHGSAHCEFSAGEAIQHGAYASNQIGYLGIIDLELGYQIEDNIALTGHLSDRYSWQKRISNYRPLYEERRHSNRVSEFWISISYALDGSLLNSLFVQDYPPYAH